MQEVVLDFCFILYYKVVNHAVSLRDCEVAVRRDASYFSFQVCEFEAQQSDGIASPAAFHGVSEREVLRICFDANGFGAVNGQVDASVI